jgi:hypothetical protein
MKHENAEMIKTKVDQMDLVLFRFRDSDGLWAVSNLNSLVIDEGCNFFLCLPQHKEACLHWLNGGESEHGGEFGQWNSCEGWNKKWFSTTCGFMRSSHQTRIKPKKEKRVIGVHRDGRTTSHYAIDDEGCYAVDEIRITGKGNPDEWLFIEIEVEV